MTLAYLDKFDTAADYHADLWENFDYSLWDIRYRQAKKSFFYFVDNCMDLLGYVNDYRSTLTKPDPPLTEYGWHIRHWCDLPYKYQHLLFRAPRDHWKTSIWTICFPIYRALFGDPSYLISIDDKLAAEKIGRVKQLIDLRPDFFNPPDNELRKLLPTRQSPTGRIGWGTEKLELANGVKIDIAGFKTSTRGPHPKLIVLDDIHGETQKFSMEYAIDHYRRTIRPMLVKGGYLIVVGTNFAEDDIYHHLEKNPLFKEPRGYAEILQAIDMDTLEVLWPEWYSYDYLQEIIEDVGILVFNCEYQNIAISEEASLFPHKLYSANFDQTATLLYQYLEGPLQVFSGWDLAIATTETADFTVGLTLGVDTFGNRQILDIFRAHGIGYSEQWDIIRSVCERFRPLVTYIEANAYQRALPEEMMKYTSYNIKPFITGSDKNTREVGIMSLRPLFENNKFRIPRGDEHSRALTDMLGHELKAMQLRDRKIISAAKHDDMVIALWIADRAAREWQSQTGWVGGMDIPGARSKIIGGDVSEYHKILERMRPQQREREA